jgi:hypothetical protein
MMPGRSRKGTDNNNSHNHSAEEPLRILANLIVQSHLKDLLHGDKGKTPPADAGNMKNA